jgi:GAF domain-containing protein
MSDSPLTESLSALSRFFVGDGTFVETLERVTELCVRAIDAADLAGLTMIVEGRRRTAVFTDLLAPEIDQAQYESGRGPCLHAFETGETQQIDSTITEQRWPEFCRSAATYGVHSTLSFPMSVDKRPLGAMNVYSRRERGFAERDREIGVLFAEQAAIVLANAQAYWDARDLNVRLGDAMEHRSIIDQAKGILMATQGCDADAAFELLVKASQRENTKLRDVATRIVSGTVQRSGAQEPTA